MPKYLKLFKKLLFLSVSRVSLPIIWNKLLIVVSRKKRKFELLYLYRESKNIKILFKFSKAITFLVIIQDNEYNFLFFRRIILSAKIRKRREEKKGKRKTVSEI